MQQWLFCSSHRRSRDWRPLSSQNAERHALVVAVAVAAVTVAVQTFRPLHRGYCTPLYKCVVESSLLWSRSTWSKKKSTGTGAMCTLVCALFVLPGKSAPRCQLSRDYHKEWERASALVDNVSPQQALYLCGRIFRQAGLTTTTWMTTTTATSTASEKKESEEIRRQWNRQSYQSETVSSVEEWSSDYNAACWRWCRWLVPAGSLCWSLVRTFLCGTFWVFLKKSVWSDSVPSVIEVKF